MKTEKSKKAKRILIAVLCVLLAALIGVVAFVWINFSRLSGDLGFDGEIVGEEYDTDDDAADLPEMTYNGGTASQLANTEGTIDILLLGVDNRDITKFTGRSDVMMYLRIDTQNKSIKLASLMRDTLVPIDGHDKNKLNTAYNYGSIELARKTIRDYFGLNPDYFMVVNFYGMEDIINAMGGVDITVESDELEWLNKLVDEINAIETDNKADHVTKSGQQHLDGRQAVAYMRIRHPGGDAGRIVRQQTVLSALFQKMKNVDILQLPALIETVADYVRTDIPAGDLINIANTVHDLGADEIGKFSFPADYELGRYEGMSIVQPADYAAEIAKLQEFLLN